MGSLQTLAAILGISVVSGINLYATALTIGLAIRYGWVTGLPPDLQVLAHPVVLIAAGAMYAVEFIADKAPFITPVWDVIHTVIRPLGASLLALGAAGNLDPKVQVLAVLAGGSSALGTHSTKMGVRLAAHAIPEPVTHSLISLAEDVGVVGLLILAWQHPLIAIPVLLGLLALCTWLLTVVSRGLRSLLRSVFGRLRAALQ
jgi:hypothetical protein